MQYTYIYRLEYVNYHYYDAIENEDVEEKFILGYFTPRYKLEEAKKRCIENGLKEEKLQVTCFFDEFSIVQKRIYVLSHMYYLYDGERYTDYEYIFPPMSNRKKCILLRERLKKYHKYAYSKNRFYDLQPPDGFCITAEEINNFHEGILGINDF